MLRRKFVGTVLAAGAAASLSQPDKVVAITKPWTFHSCSAIGKVAEFSLVYVQSEGHRSVHLSSSDGDEDKVIEFMHAYQDALWPEWRKHPETVKKYEKAEQFIGEYHHIYLYVGCQQTAKAFDAAKLHMQTKYARYIRNRSVGNPVA